MRTILLSLVGALLVGALSIAGATGVPDRDPPSASARPAAPTVSWFPERPVQGHLFRIRVSPAPGEEIQAVRGEIYDEALHFEPVGDGAMESLAPVPIEIEESVSFELVVTLDDGREETLGVVVDVQPGEYRHERLTVAPRLGGRLNDADAARLAQDQAKAAEVARQAHATPRLWTDERVMPREDRVTSGFGNGRVFNGEVSSRHMGLDLDGDPGDVVVAPARGVVALVDSFLLAGDIVYLNHGGGLLSGYFHLSEQLVQEGDTVTAGTPIGRVGATGRVTGPHLHWVVRIGTTSVDPRSWMALPGSAASGGSN